MARLNGAALPGAFGGRVLRVSPSNKGGGSGGAAAHAAALAAVAGGAR